MAATTSGRLSPMSPTSVLVCDGDELGRRALGQTITDNGLVLSGEASTAVQALQMLTHTPAAVVVIANDLLGLSGIEVTPELVAAGHQVILVSADPIVLDQARRAGAVAAVRRGDLASFALALVGLGQNGAASERRTGMARRSGLDRRVTQNWSLVTRERRVGDRRQADRRGNVTDPATWSLAAT